jgi:hypothetical protein
MYVDVKYAHLVRASYEYMCVYIGVVSVCIYRRRMCYSVYMQYMVYICV